MSARRGSVSICRDPIFFLKPFEPKFYDHVELFIYSKKIKWM